MRRRLLRPSPRRAPPPADVVERALDRLERLGYLNDAEFAAYWAEQRERFSPRSARAVRQELRQRGVDAETAAASADPDDDEQRAIAAGRKRLRSLDQADYQTFYTRMGGFLQRRGFSYGVARVAIRHSGPSHAVTASRPPPPMTRMTSAARTRIEDVPLSPAEPQKSRGLSRPGQARF